MQIDEDEKYKSTCEIEELRNEIHRQEQKLNKSLHLLSEKDTQLQTIEKRCQELETCGEKTAAENQQLTAELGALQDQLGEAKQHEAKLSEKSRTYRMKLNEAISEQQTLFTRSRTFYQECLEELQKEKSNRAEHALSVDKALETSRKKREEVKECFQQFRHEMELESQKSRFVSPPVWPRLTCANLHQPEEKVISELEAQVKYQEAELIRERDCVTDLKTRIEEQPQTRLAITRIESQVQALIDADAERSGQDRTGHESVAQLMAK